MTKIAIFVLGKIDHIWSLFFDMFLVKVDYSCDKDCTCSTGHLQSWIYMQAYVKLNTQLIYLLELILDNFYESYLDDI